MKKDYSIETLLLARAKERALSKTTWLDEMMEEKNCQSISSKAASRDPNGRHASVMLVNELEDGYILYKCTGRWVKNTATWYKINHTGKQAVSWDIRSNTTSSTQASRFLALDVPVCSLLFLVAYFVPYDR